MSEGLLGAIKHTLGMECDHNWRLQHSVAPQTCLNAPGYRQYRCTRCDDMKRDYTTEVSR